MLVRMNASATRLATTGPLIIPITSPTGDEPGRCITDPVTSTIAGQIAW